MKRFFKSRLLPLAVLVVLLLPLTVLFMRGPKFPTALIRVVDSAGKPIAGVSVKIEGLRTKQGPYVSGWYTFEAAKNGIPVENLKTESDGFVRLQYPKYVFEKVDTGTLCLAVNHPDYVADRPERVVSSAPGSGASWSTWFHYVADRILNRRLVVPTDPLVLKKGAVLKITVRLDSPGPKDTPLYAQVSGDGSHVEDFWSQPEPGVLVTHKLGDGPRSIRALRYDNQGGAWFSDVTNIVVATNQSIELAFNLQHGVTLRGKLDDSTPRSIVNGHVVIQVWPPNCKPENNPPVWHTWTNIAPDGTFTIGSIPAGDLEVVAICDGWVMTNGPGKFKMHYPQKHAVGTNDLDIIVGMERTARMEVHVSDDQGKPLKDATVSTWPNTRYGEWSAVILGADRYSTTDFLKQPGFKFRGWSNPTHDFSATTDSSGLAVLTNIPADVTQFVVENESYVMPATKTSWGQERREGDVKLICGGTNVIWLKMEPRGKKPLKQY